MEVRAALGVKAGQPLEITTVQLDGPREGEVLVEIKATGYVRLHRQCHRDAASA
jgi:S-(hydroxymethyl)glutathione dehydrogenase/alcohol dehydrogenase